MRTNYKHFLLSQKTKFCKYFSRGLFSLTRARQIDKPKLEDKRDKIRTLSTFFSKFRISRGCRGGYEYVVIVKRVGTVKTSNIGLKLVYRVANKQRYIKNKVATQTVSTKNHIFYNYKYRYDVNESEGEEMKATYNTVQYN